MAYTKIGNRYYDKITEDEVDYVVKATYNEDDEEYIECGKWTVTEFLAHATPFDQNTEDNYAEIVSQLGLE